ncbi:MAG TPA: nuclear transport factor 2 family protein [Solirubrobacteraceae bacterium]|nr:nuclear transport factor 2 family protein [Solirubrobacteraceae bacterium]
MSQQNVELVRRAYEQFSDTGRFVADAATPDFVWDMSNFHAWPEQQLYEGVAAAEGFLRDWAAAWDDWELEVGELLDAGDKVVALVHQRGRSRAAGMSVEMSFAQVWTMCEGKQARMEMYSDPNEALAAVGLAE